MRFLQALIVATFFAVFVGVAPQPAYAGPKRELKKAVSLLCSLDLDVEAVTQLRVLYTDFFQLYQELLAIWGQLSQWDFEFRIEDCTNFDGSFDWQCELDAPTMDELMQCFGDLNFEFQCDVDLPDLGEIQDCLNDALGDAGAGCDFDIDFDQDDIRECMETQFHIPDITEALALLLDVWSRIQNILHMEFWAGFDIQLDAHFFDSIEMLVKWCDKYGDTFFNGDGWKCQ